MAEQEKEILEEEQDTSQAGEKSGRGSKSLYAGRGSCEGYRRRERTGYVTGSGGNSG